MIQYKSEKQFNEAVRAALLSEAALPFMRAFGWDGVTSQRECWLKFIDELHDAGRITDGQADELPWREITEGELIAALNDYQRGGA